MKNTIDIKFKGENLEKRLSNLYPYSFTFDGLTYASMESFIGSLRTSSMIEKQMARQIATNRLPHLQPAPASTPTVTH